MAECKNEIRKRILAFRDLMSPEERERGTLLMTDRILGHQWFYRCEDFLCFVSFGSEIGTEKLIQEALRQGKHTFVPRVIQKNSKPVMEFYRITSPEELIPGYRGIREPSGESEKYVYTQERAEKTLMLMPGVAFDCYRNRIGYGKGFYDRYLMDKDSLQLRTLAVGFKCQLVEEIPSDKTDIKPYQVLCF